MNIKNIDIDNLNDIILPDVKRKTKPLMVIQSPFGTRSGYGDHSRDIIKGLIESDKYDIKLLSTRWGDTPMNALEFESEEWRNKFVEHTLVNTQEIQHIVQNKLIDIFIQITIPNEFNPVGKFNIGITAGIETNLCSGEWVLGMNRMDLNIVPSNHAKTVFENSEWTMKDERTGQESQLKCTKPIKVLFEGNDNKKYYPIKYKEYTSSKDIQSSMIVKDLNEFSKDSDFNFLFVGHWLNGDFGEDRKDVSGLIYTFLHTFNSKNKDDKKPSLILKANLTNNSIGDRLTLQKYIDNIKNRVKGELRRVGVEDINLPKIMLLHGQLTDTQMNLLYNHPSIKTMVSFTKGEGYGRPLQEFASTGKPVIASNWSGQIDFLDPHYNVLLEGDLKQVHPSVVWKDVILQESQWFTVDYKKAKEVLIDMYKKYNSYKINGLNNTNYISSYFSLDKMNEMLVSIIDEYTQEQPIPDISTNLNEVKDALTMEMENG